MFNNYESIFLCVILFLISLRFIELKWYFKDEIFFSEHVNFKNILSIDECKDIINVVSKIKFETYDEDSGSEKHKRDNVEIHECMEGHSVSFPVYQNDVLQHNKTINNKLWKDNIEPLYNKKIKPLIHKLPWSKGKKVSLSWVFIKRYKKCERTHLRTHLDSNYFTFNILLSSTKDFKGGELYIFDNYYSNKYKNIVDLTLEKHDGFIKNIKNDLPIIKDYDQGDVLSFVGENHLHGTLPVVEGERYVLVLFFEVS